MKANPTPLTLTEMERLGSTDDLDRRPIEYLEDDAAEMIADEAIPVIEQFCFEEIDPFSGRPIADLLTPAEAVKLFYSRSYF